MGLGSAVGSGNVQDGTLTKQGRPRKNSGRFSQALKTRRPHCLHMCHFHSHAIDRSFIMSYLVTIHVKNETASQQAAT